MGDVRIFMHASTYIYTSVLARLALLGLASLDVGCYVSFPFVPKRIVGGRW